MPTEKNLEVARVYEECGGNVSEAARRLGMSRSGVLHHARAAGVYGKPLHGGQVRAPGRDRRELPTSGVKTYLLTSVQNNTKVWQPFYRNLRAYQDFREAELLPASFTYNQNSYGKLSVKRGTKASTETDLWYDPEIVDLLETADRDIELAPGLVWCGSMNTLPTTGNPLAGFETHTGEASGVFPHAKVAMRSVAQNPVDGAKFNYTTGALTQRNYIQKAAGKKAEHHHVYGALVVEVMPDGNWYARQLNADSRGNFYDLNWRVADGEVEEGEWTEAITWGDIHEVVLDETVRRLAWAEGGMLDELHPRFQFMHDTLDFRARNHHERKNPHTMFRRFIEGQDSVEAEVASAVQFLNEESWRPWCETKVVDSNHDGALGRWLREADYRTDPVNAYFFLQLQMAVYEAISNRDENFHVVEHAMKIMGARDEVEFLREDQPFVICREVDCGAHGHLGPDGSRGSPNNLRRQGRKANTGHTHSAGIFDGLYVAGVSGRLRQGYNRGPSSWSHSHTVTYRNAKRCIVTMTSEGWRGR